MALPHDPGTCAASQCVGKQISHVSLHHVQRATGVAFRCWLKILGGQCPTGEINAVGIAHVCDHIHGGTSQPVGSSEQCVDGLLISNNAFCNQTFDQCVDTVNGLVAMDDGAVA